MIDLHVDFIIQQRLFGYDALKRHRAGRPGQPYIWHSDLPRLLEASFTGVCLGVHYWPWQSEKAFVEMNAQIDYLDEIAQRHASVLRVRDPSDWQRARDLGKLAVAPGVEGAHMLNGNLARVEHLARRDVAYLTLAHFSKNAAATPSLGRGSNETDGLSPFGRDLVAELERCDVLIDLAHVNTPGVLEACSLATKPLLCTHTGIKGAHDHARNISDAELDAIRDTGGAVGIMYAPCFMADSLKATSEIVLDHIEYAVDRVGADHVALGSDYDGWLPTIPRDMRDCRDAHKILDGLARRGWDPQDIEKIHYKTALRVLSRQPVTSTASTP